MGRLDDWFNLPREEVARRTLRTAKTYLAEKSDTYSSQFAHPEYMEHAELLAEQIGQQQADKRSTEDK